MSDELSRLADAIRQRNEADAEIARIINRPAERGHMGEYIAASIFDIALNESATHKSTDGHFRAGPLEGQSVNIKFYGKREGILDLCPCEPPDLYLVLTGPKSAMSCSAGDRRPVAIESVYLFNSAETHGAVTSRGRKIGTATSVLQQDWDEAEIYPNPRNVMTTLDDEQRSLLAFFSTNNLCRRAN